MSELFISYAKEDRAIAERLVEALQGESGSIFFAPEILAGADWSNIVEQELRTARSVIVLWSKASRTSLWVQAEAAHAFETDRYIPVSIDGEPPPKLFHHLQAPSIQAWVASGDPRELDQLRQSIYVAAKYHKHHNILERVGPNEAVTSAHLYLVHSCWRVDKESRFGKIPYQIHVIVYGDKTALDRIEYVQYYLPGYPKEREIQRSDNASRLYEIKELSNGFTIIQADIFFRSFIDDSRRERRQTPLRISRFINVSDSGPRLEDFIVRRPQDEWINPDAQCR